MPTVNLKIDDRDVTIEAGATIMEAAKTLGLEIPHYCYHPGLSLAGNCRMCLVQVEKMPKPVISCMTPVAEGMVVNTRTPEVKKLQKIVMEFLLVNHPLDCPTCDQAGECRLQDYYMEYDRVPSRFKEAKVRKDKMVDLGAGVMLDEERCIVCTRCVRFCNEIAGQKELYVQERGDHAMVATFPGKKMSNPYAGCTVDVCPVGALTSKDFRYKKRVWFLNRADSVCPGCSRGCNIEIHHADRKVYRLKPRFNAEVNKYWMCDEGRGDYGFVNEDRRLKPACRENGKWIEDAPYERALSVLAEALGACRSSELAFVASVRESNEAIDAFVEFARGVFDATEVYFSKNDPANPYSDDILIKADKNPNLHHAVKLGLKPVAQLPAGVKALVVQRDLSAADLAFVAAKKIEVVLAFTTNRGPLDELARVVLPIPTYAEQSGRFTNFEGREQHFAAAFEPRGESKPIQFYLADLAKRRLAGSRKAG